MFFGYESFRQLRRTGSRWRLLSQVPRAMSLARTAAGLPARRSGNARWRYAPDWARTIVGAWWLRPSVIAPKDLHAFMRAETTAETLCDFDTDHWMQAMTESRPWDLTLALAQIESMTYLPNQLLRDSDWAAWTTAWSCVRRRWMRSCCSSCGQCYRCSLAFLTRPPVGRGAGNTVTSHNHRTLQDRFRDTGGEVGCRKRLQGWVWSYPR